jgi:uncharacterized protein YkwD
MKRTKKMMLVTLMATTAVAMLLMSKAFAAPAFTTGTCPTQNLLSQFVGSGSSLPTGTSTSNCPKTAALQSLLNGASLPTGTTSNCPKTAALQSLLNGASLPSTTTGSTCPAKNLLGQLLGGNTTGTVTLPKSTCPKASAPVATPEPTTSTVPAPTATPAPTTGTTTVPPVTGSMTADESKMINLVNQDRANNGLKPLTFDAGLRAGALAHSQDMSQNNYFSHTSPTLGDYGTRLKASGVKYSSAGENIAMYPSVDQAEVGFMNSPGHRANILGDYTRVGIGIVYNQSKGEYYITQWFAK